jgi:hypothetical protein
MPAALLESQLSTLDLTPPAPGGWLVVLEGEGESSSVQGAAAAVVRAWVCAECNRE